MTPYAGISGIPRTYLRAYYTGHDPPVVPRVLITAISHGVREDYSQACNFGRSIIIVRSSDTRSIHGERDFLPGELISRDTVYIVESPSRSTGGLTAARLAIALLPFLSLFCASRASSRGAENAQSLTMGTAAAGHNRPDKLPEDGGGASVSLSFSAR